MQLVILVYHYTGASRVLEIYMFIRILVSSYLFLNGFAHFQFFWSRAQQQKTTTLEAGKGSNIDGAYQALARYLSVCCSRQSLSQILYLIQIPNLTIV